MDGANAGSAALCCLYGSEKKSAALTDICCLRCKPRQSAQKIAVAAGTKKRTMSSSLETTPSAAAEVPSCGTSTDTTTVPSPFPASTSPVVTLPSSVLPPMTPQGGAGFVPSERRQDCSICRHGLNPQALAESGACCTIPSHFLNAVEPFPAPATLRSGPVSEELAASKELSPEETFSELVKRLRGLLSRQNVSVDPSIALLMVGSPWMEPTGISAPEKNDIYITVDALMSHPVIASLKASKETIIKAAEAVGPHVLRVNKEAERIFPIMKAQRCTLILRNLECQVDELREFVSQAPSLQKYTESEPILEMRKEIVGGQINWFVTLPTADDATETALWLRQQKFNDQDIRVGVKSESEFQSFMSRPMPTWNMEGAFVPLVAMQYGLDGKTRMRRGGQRGGRMTRGGRTRGGANNRRNWSQDNGSHTAEVMRTRGSRGSGRGGRSRGLRRGARFPDWYDGNERDGAMIVGDGIREEVDPNEFPPLMESAKLSNFGYGGREFKQYSPTTLRELRDRVHNSATEVAM
eukprot:Gregarina_sp_Poly_1__378@NODE_1094_length_5111_cov_363_423473_g758_i0_p2_GENE_NODE_1094_length_5111_cov_363_423473_g758_i0NODE_1094_length_5111_cov_363_423473_g758_i0_p2_ORF_typecomplete_len524_score79_40_NODE_1094_length_5111_cov_363_423473_g758_i034325003